MNHLLSKSTVLILLFVVIPHASANFSPADYGRTFRGDGTYYGYTDAGNCAYRQRPPSYERLVGVAINQLQYADSRSCGSCVQFSGKGKGSGANPITGSTIGIITDRCPECHHGDLDLSKSGDGRWIISWRFIECPFDDDLTFFLEGSHKWYWKIQARGLKYPIQSIRANGVQGIRTNDNFFIMQNDGGHKLPCAVYVTDIKGRKFTAYIDYIDNESVVKPRRVEGPQGGSSGGSGGGSSNPRPQNRPPSPKPPQRPKCVPNGYSCAPNSWFRTSKCCHKNAVCKFVASKGRLTCVKMNKPKKCLPKGRRCTWNNGRRKNRPCCKNMKCRKRRNWRFRRCIFV